jgi:ribosomal protein S27E
MNRPSEITCATCGEVLVKFSPGKFHIIHDNTPVYVIDPAKDEAEIRCVKCAHATPIQASWMR